MKEMEYKKEVFISLDCLDWILMEVKVGNIQGWKTEGVGINQRKLGGGKIEVDDHLAWKREID